MWNKVSMYNCLKVSCYKHEEHPLRISALEICLGVSMGSRDTDPKLLCSSGIRGFQALIGSGEFGFSRANWIHTSSAVKYLVFVFLCFFYLALVF